MLSNIAHYLQLGRISIIVNVMSILTYNLISTIHTDLTRQAQEIHNIHLALLRVLNLKNSRGRGVKSMTLKQESTEIEFIIDLKMYM